MQGLVSKTPDTDARVNMTAKNIAAGRDGTICKIMYKYKIADSEFTVVDGDARGFVPACF